MRPKLKVNDIRNLHDARYCSAVGISLLSYRLESDHQNFISSKEVKEISGWLSGPVAILTFGYEAPEDINALGEEIQPGFVSVPWDYPIDLLRLIDFDIILVSSKAESATAIKSKIEETSELSNIYYEFQIPEESHEMWSYLKEHGLVGRIYFQVTDPDKAWKLLEKNGDFPAGFSLGEYFNDGPDLDYDKCDNFVERYNELLPA